MYTTQKIFPKRESGDKYLIPVKINGGSLDIEYPVGASWIIDRTITADGAFEASALSQVRITPSGGAEYDLF
jgi:hypothetical protein